MANNVRITSAPELVYRHNDAIGGPGTVYIRFPLRWENSWRSNRPRNWDAVWVFAKAWDGNRWAHVYFDSDSTRHHFGMGAGPNHQTVTANCRLGVQMQETNPAVANRMVIEPGRSMVQLVGQDATEPWVSATVGVFIYRLGTGRGTVDLRSVYLLWNYTRQGFFEDDELAIKVFAIEMVFIPAGAFYVGSAPGGTERGAFRTATSTDAAREPFRISSEGAIYFGGTTAGNLQVVGTGRRDPTTATFRIPPEFPKGFRAFYIMKYDLTQEGWAQFLNTLNFTQQDQHTGRRTGAAILTPLTPTLVGQNPFRNRAHHIQERMHRNHLVQVTTEPSRMFGTNARGVAPPAANPNAPTQTWHSQVAVSARAAEHPAIAPPTGVPFAGSVTDTRSTDGQDLAMNLLSWFNVLAFAEWSGLRPMTEFEFEKAARGPAATAFPVPNEFPWGSVLINASGVGRAHNQWQIDIVRQNTFTSYTATHTAFALANMNTGDERFHAQMNVLAVASVRMQSRTGDLQGGTHNFEGAWPTWRVGAFANESSTRQSAGASYWGVMNMADLTNIIVINATEQPAHTFRGDHGTGNLRLDGNFHARHNWPTAAGTWFPKGVTMWQERVQSWAGASQGTANATQRTNSTNHNNTQWNNASTARTNFLGSIDMNSARISDRYRTQHVVHFQNNHADFVSPGVRLVRTAGWLLPGTPEAAAVGGGGGSGS